MAAHFYNDCYICNSKTIPDLYGKKNQSYNLDSYDVTLRLKLSINKLHVGSLF